MFFGESASERSDLPAGRQGMRECRLSANLLDSACNIAGNFSGELIYLLSIPTKDAKEND